MRGETFAAFREIVRRIPAGKVATYGQIAHLAGRPRCARAVGCAMAGCQDPSVPCHRVVGSNGSLTGYAGGLDIKIDLLEREGVDMGRLYRPKKGTAI